MFVVMLELGMEIHMMLGVMEYYSSLLIREINIMVKIIGYGKFFFKPMRLFGKELRLMMIIGLHGNKLINF